MPKDSFPDFPPDNSSDGASLDLSQLLHALNGDRRLLNEILGMFLGEVPPLMEDLTAAVEAADMPNIMAHAHKLRGVFLNLAASSAAGLAHKIETAGRVGALRDAVEALPFLEIESRRALLDAAAQKESP